MKAGRSEDWAPSRLVPLLVSTSPLLATTLLVTVVVRGLVPAALVWTGGRLVGALPPASGAGGSGLAPRAGAVVALFVAAQLLAPVQLAVADALGRRLGAGVRQRAMRAAMAPAGVGHLEDPVVLGHLAVTRGSTTGDAGPRDAVVGLASVAFAQFAGLATAAVLVVYAWWLSLGLVVAYVIMRRALLADLRRHVAALSDPARWHRRPHYLRDLALTPAAAKEVRVFGLAGWLGERYDTEWHAAMAGLHQARRRGWWTGPACAALLLVIETAALAGLGLAAAHGALPLSGLVACAGAIGGLDVMLSLGNDNLNLRRGVAAVPATLALERAAVRHAGTVGTVAPALMPARAIRLERVSFRYPGREEEACSELDLEVPAGRSLAIVGANGAGKTTVMKLLGRLYDPTAGRVTVDGIDLRLVDTRAWQRRIAVVVQDLVRYPLALRDNVGFGALEWAGDDHAIARAVEAAGAAELVAGLPFGWETVLSRQFAGGVELSGGQWQRVALARALLAVDAGAGLLLLDEPTAHLDAAGEAEVNRVLLRLGRHLDRPLTTVLVSHRFSTVRHADRIVVLEGGRVAEDGSHASLMAAGGRYAAMFTLQATPYRDGAQRV